MTDHLPECTYLLGQPGFGGIDSGISSTQPHFATSPCICPALGIGFAAGLNAAREAVAALEPMLDVNKHNGGYDCCGCSTPAMLLDDAVTAIDSLREKT